MVTKHSQVVRPVTLTISGRANEYLVQPPSHNSALKYYIYGNAEMVVDIRDVSISKGIPIDHILSEIFLIPHGQAFW